MNVIDEALERVELDIPEFSVLRHPIPCVSHGAGNQAALAHATALDRANESSALQDAHVL
ncbi:MAG: hypothetical protein U0132_14360 [Gemmatimonadaceae bacterium]